MAFKNPFAGQRGEKLLIWLLILSITMFVLVLAIVTTKSFLEGHNITVLWLVACVALGVRKYPKDPHARSLITIVGLGTGALAAVWGILLGTFAFATFFIGMCLCMLVWKYLIGPRLARRKDQQTQRSDQTS